MWLGAKIGEVEQEKRKKAEEEYEAADWEYSREFDEVGRPMVELQERMMMGKEYLGESDLSFPGGLLGLKELCELPLHVGGCGVEALN